MPKQRCACGTILSQVGTCTKCGDYHHMPAYQTADDVKRIRIAIDRMRKDPELAKRVVDFLNIT